MKRVGDYELHDCGCGVNVYLNDACIATITGVMIDNDISEEELEELLFDDVDEDDCIIEDIY